GRAEIAVRENKGLFAGFEPRATTIVWASHGDRVDEAPPHFRVTATSANAPVAGIQHDTKPIYGLLFHPEVAHTPRGGEILHNFLFAICGCTPDWTPGHFIDQEVARIRELVGPAGRAICGLSGGVDSAVAAALMQRAIGNRLTCVFVDHGLLRRGEREQVEQTFRAHLGMDLRVVDATHRPLRELFKDEVRQVGRELGLPEEIVGRHPFPGPGLAIRVLGPVNEERLDLLRKVDAIYLDEIRAAGLYDQIWQAFAVLLPIKSV